MKSVNECLNPIYVLLFSLVILVANNVFAKNLEFKYGYAEKVNTTPLQITDFDSVITVDGIELYWYVHAAGTPEKLEIERSADDIYYETVDWIMGSEVDSQTVKFVYYDFNLPRGHYYYRLKSITEPGVARYSKSVFINASSSVEAVLEQNTPNPFNPVTNIQFRLATRDKVSLRVYNILGQQINTLMDGYFDRGIYNIKWNGRDDAGRDVTGGVYFYQILIGRYAETRRMVLVR